MVICERHADVQEDLNAYLLEPEALQEEHLALVVERVEWAHVEEEDINVN